MTSHSEKTEATEGRIPESEWRWFGNAGHFICARWCRFHMVTQIGQWFVSTVGEYVPSEVVQTINAQNRGNPLTKRGDAREAEFIEKFGFEKLGAWGTYETLVFKAGKPCDAPECGGCGLPYPDSWSELDGERYENAKDATDGHRRYCEMAARGEIKDREEVDA